MSGRSRNAAEIAASLYAELGHGAVPAVSARVEAARQASDLAEVRHWTDVAQALLAQARPAGGDDSGGRRPADTRPVDTRPADTRPADTLWAFMQRIEYCRHRAEEFERKAAAAPEAYRQDMLELAVQWRDLALHTDLQARSAGV